MILFAGISHEYTNSQQNVGEWSEYTEYSIELAEGQAINMLTGFIDRNLQTTLF